jgi:D-aspartate ligase
VVQRPGAIVIGGHFQGLGVIRALGRLKVPVVLMDQEPCMARYSRYIYKYFKCPPVNHEFELLDYLLQREMEALAGCVIFPTDDETVSFLSRHKSDLEHRYRVFTPGWKTIRYVHNKEKSYRLAERCNIPIPKTYYPKKIEDLDGIETPFPLIVKPAVMHSFFRVTGKKVFQANDRSELIKSYEKAVSIVGPDEILIQEKIPDVSRHLYSFCPFYKYDRTVAYIIARRTRQHPMDFGHASTFAETVSIGEIKELGERFLSAIHYYGLCEVEFIQDPRDWQFKFLEVNPRIWGWHTLAIRSGVNLPYMVYRDMLHQTIPPWEFKAGIKWIHLMTDIPTVLGEIIRGRLNITNYLQSLKGEKEYAVWAKDDPLPFLCEIILLPYLFMKRGF